MLSKTQHFGLVRFLDFHIGGGGFKRKILGFWLRWGMMGQRTGNYKGSEFRYLGGCWSYPLRGHVYGPGLATPKLFSTETEMEFPAGANSPLPVELGQPPPGLLTFQRALRFTSVTHLPHCAELQSDTRPPPALLGTAVGVSPNLPTLQQPDESTRGQGNDLPGLTLGGEIHLFSRMPVPSIWLSCPSLSSADLWSLSRRGVVCLSPRWGV